MPDEVTNVGQQQPAVAPAAPEVQTNPEPFQGNVQGTSSRTADQFEKLLEHNKRLFEQNQLLRQAQQSVSQPQRQPVQQAAPQSGPQVSAEDFIEVDASTGERYINDQKLKDKIRELNELATTAKTTVQNYIKTAEEREVDRQNREAFTAFPELNPTGDKFDAEFHRQVRAVLYDSMIYPGDYGGRTLEFKEAAQKVVDRYGRPSDKKKEEAQQQQQQQAQQQQEARGQASASVPSTPPARQQQAMDDADLQRLRLQTRTGNNEALALRLQWTDHKGTPTNSA